MSAARRALGVVGLIVAAFAVGLVVVEAALRFVIPMPNVYRLLLPGTRIFEPDPRFVHGITGPARYIVNQHGIRGRDFGPDSGEYRVLLVGGSTTECALLDEAENWGSVTERLLGTTRDGRRVWIGNVGRSGLTARDHVVSLKHLLPQYPRIDLVVVLAGVNDLTAALRQGGAYRSPPRLSDPVAEEIQVRNAFALSPGGFREMFTRDLIPEKKAWYKSTSLYQLAKRAWTGIQARRIVRGIGGATLGQWRDHRQHASEVIEQLPDLTAPLADYRQYLEDIVREARKRNTEVMLMTLPSLWRADLSQAEAAKLWLGGTGAFQEEPGHAYYSIAALSEAMARYNEDMLAVCRDNKLSCLDLAPRVPKDTLMFYDDVHYTEAGAELIGRLLATHLRSARADIFGAAPRP